MHIIATLIGFAIGLIILIGLLAGISMLTGFTLSQLLLGYCVGTCLMTHDRVIKLERREDMRKILK